MELFTINRYNEESEAKEKNDAKEDELLKKLLKKAQRRKRTHSGEEVPVPLPPPGENDPISIIQSILSEATIFERDLIAKEESQTTGTEKPSSQDETKGADSADFQVLGEKAGSTKPLPKVEMVLPAWLRHPTLIESKGMIRDEETEGETDEAAVKEQSYLTPETRRALKHMKIKRLFPVQRAVIPWILSAHDKPAPLRPRDICISAPTGSGKTLAFAIPIVQLLQHRVDCKVRALIVVPVAELALQVYKVFIALCSQMELQVCLLTKQHKLEAEQEKLVELYKGTYYSKVDIIVSTPGRLVDHLHSTKGLCLKALRFLVIDEADRIMDEVFQNWMYHVDKHVQDTAHQLFSDRVTPLCLSELRSTFGNVPHKMLFSATLSQDPEKLQELRLFHPKLFTTVRADPAAYAALKAAATSTQTPTEQSSGQFVGKYTTPEELTEQYCLTETRLKPLTLFALIMENGWKRFLCFTNNAEAATRLTFVLQKLLNKHMMTVSELSAKLSAVQRNAEMSKFIRGKINGLICSDALARGIDLPDVDIVISYDMPRHITTYIHRVGRTARAGRKGTAITLLTEEEQEKFDKMLAEADKKVTEEIGVSADFETEHAIVYKDALSDLRTHMETAKNAKIMQKRRIARQANIHKDPSQLTVMEKLQMSAGTEITKPKEDKLDQKVNKKTEKAAVLAIKPKERKFNPKLGKRNNIDP